MKTLTGQLFFTLFLFIPGLIAALWSSIRTHKNETQLFSDLADTNPKMKWLPWGFILGLILVVYVLSYPLFIWIPPLFGTPDFLFFGHLAALVGLFQGAFALATQVIIVILDWRRLPFKCIAGERAVAIGNAQVLISLVVLIFNTIVISFLAL